MVNAGTVEVSRLGVLRDKKVKVCTDFTTMLVYACVGFGDGS